MLALVVLCVAFLPASVARGDLGNDVPQTTWVPSGGGVNVVAVSGSTAYVGGDFGYMGPQSGSFVALNSNLQTLASGWPTVGGSVFASAPDGSGGWFIGGDFSEVGDVAVENLAHILSNGTVDTSWEPATDGPVYTLAVANGEVFAGGSFENAFGVAYDSGAEVARNDLAAFDASGGAVEPWDPDTTTAASGGLNFVEALLVAGSTVYAGGAFDHVNGGAIARANLAAFDETDGDATSWDPSVADGTALPGSSTPETAVFALCVSGSDIVAGGDFTAASESTTPVTRDYLASFDEAGGAVTSWNPEANASVYALAASGSLIYSGGDFTAVNGSTTRHYAAAFDASSGTASIWNPATSGSVYTLAVSGSNILVGGDFQGVNNSVFSRNLGGFEMPDGALTEASYVDGPVYTIGVSGSTVFAGGDFQAFGGDVRNNLAAIDLDTGQDTSWNPNVNGTVSSLAVSGSTVYAAGDFSEVNGSAGRNNAAAFDATSGTATSWNPDLNSPAQTLIVSGSTVYVGGNFTSVNVDTTPTTRKYLAAFDEVNGTVTSWNPDVGGTSPVVYELAASDSTIYAGGSFSTVNGSTARSNIAAFDPTSGTATSWNPDISGTPPQGGTPDVLAIAAAGQTIYVGGDFSTVNSTITRNNAAAFDATTGDATAWNPDPEDSVSTLVASSTAVFVGGGFVGFNGAGPNPTSTIRNFLADFDPTTGALLPWNPDADGFVTSLALTSTSLLAGGGFSAFGFGDNDQADIAAFDVPGAPTGVAATAGAGSATVSFTAPAANGAAIDSYTVTSSGGETATGTSSPITVNGLTSGQSYTFTVTASSVIGTSTASNPSSPVTVGAPHTGGGGGGGGGSDGISMTLSPSGQTVAAGATATFTVGITNSGAGYLFNVGASDPAAPGCNQATSNTPAATLATLETMAPGVTVTYTCTASVTSSLTNTITANGTGPDAVTVTATASASVTVTPPPSPAPVSTHSSGTAGATSTKASSSVASLTVSGLKVVLLHKKLTLHLTTKLSAATTLNLTLFSSNNRGLTHWLLHAKKGSHPLTLLLLSKASKPGHDKLEITEAGNKKAKTFPVTINA